MENDPDDHAHANVDTSEVVDCPEEEKCTILIEECKKDISNDNIEEDQVDAEVLPLSREEKFRLLNLKCERLIRYLSTGTHMRGLTQNQKRIVRLQAKSHIWDKSRKNLYYTATKDSRRVLVVRDENEVDGIIHSAHMRNDGGHHGINNTAANIAAVYFWNNIRQDVMDFVSKCYHCQSKNRGPSKKIKERDGAESAEVDADEDIEFTHDATKALIEAVRRRYGQLSERHTRPILYKEVQEELAQKGFYFNKERVRRKWNTLVAMHKRMRREFFEVNPTWEYYQMIDSFHGDPDFAVQDNKASVSFITNQGSSINFSQENSPVKQDGNVNVSPVQHENVFSCQQANVYASPPSNAYPTNQVNNNSINYENTYPSYGGHTYASAHQVRPCNVTQSSTCTVFQTRGINNTTQGQNSYMPQLKNVTVVKPKIPAQSVPRAAPPKDANTINKSVPMIFKIVPDLTGVQGVSAAQVPPITVVGALPGQKDVKHVSSPQIVLNKPLPKQNVPPLQNSHEEYMQRHEKLKLKTLMRIEKELKNLSQIQSKILTKQDQLLHAVMNNSTCEKKSDSEEKQEGSDNVKKKRKT